MEKVEVHPDIFPIYDQMVGIRRHFHKHPELGFDIPLISTYVANFLQELGLEVHRGIGQSGVIGIKRGGSKIILFRADMDALPISQQTDLPFKSVNPGKMHACGHDSHTTMLLGAAKALAAKELNVTIKFLFQPAEELGKGALAMIKDGAMEGVDQCYALHVFPKIQLGDCYISSSYSMADSTQIQIELVGKGGHGCMPHLTVNPVVVGSYLVQSFYSIMPNSVNSTESAVLNFTNFFSGQTFNAIPTYAYIKGTMRTYSPDTKALILQRMREISQGFQKSFKCNINLKFFHTVGPTKNSEPAVSLARRAFQAVSRGEIEDAAVMAGEDFGQFSQIKPGCMMLLGCGNGVSQTSLHSETFILEEEAMMIGASWFVRIAELANQIIK